MSELSGQFWQALERLVTDPTRRVFWPFLLGSLILAGAVYLWRQRRVSGLLGYLFPWRLWWTRSSRLDLKLTLFGLLLRPFWGVIWGVTAFSLAFKVANGLDRRFGIPGPSELTPYTIAGIFMVCLFVSWDLSRYLLHRLFHRIPLLWQFHQVHHSAEHLTPMTLYRVHPVESALYALRGILVTGLLTGIFFHFFRARAVQLQLMGINALGFLFSLFGANLRHSYVWLSYGRWLERLFISPAQHQIHHSRRPEHFDKNFGTWLAVWDWLAGSLVMAGPPRRLRFGIGRAHRNHHPHSLFSALLRPFVGLFVWQGRSSEASLNELGDDHVCKKSVETAAVAAALREPRAGAREVAGEGAC